MEVYLPFNVNWRLSQIRYVCYIFFGYVTAFLLGSYLLLEPFNEAPLCAIGKRKVR